MATKKAKVPALALKRSNESASLWNFTLSPGWTKEEAEVMRLALMKFGVGNWTAIRESGCLPGKTNAQLNNQTQRMLGQQSTAEFTDLHVDPLKIGEVNAQKQGDHIRRKNGCIVNTGDKLTREQVRKKIEENRAKYEIPKEEYEAIELPAPKPEENALVLLEEKRQQLTGLLAELHEVRTRIGELKGDTARDEQQAKRSRTE